MGSLPDAKSRESVLHALRGWRRRGVDNKGNVCYNMDMMDFGDILRDAVRASGLSMKKLSEDSGVNRISLMRFMGGSMNLNLHAASRLAAYFGLVLVPEERVMVPSKGKTKR